MKIRKETILYLVCLSVLFVLGCGVKGPPTPYVDVEEKVTTQSNQGKGSNNP
jgi:predicted small lipoprotein YifL